MERLWSGCERVVIQLSNILFHTLQVGEYVDRVT